MHRKYFWILSCFTVILFIWLALLTRGLFDFSDLYVYRGAGEHALAHTTSYIADEHFTFNYSPFAALFYALTLAQFSFVTAAWGWLTCSFVLWITLAIFWLKRQPLLFTQRWGIAIVLTALFGVSLRDELKLSQVQVLPLAVSFFGLLLLERSQKKRNIGLEIGAGLAIAFAIDIKITFATLMLPLIFTRRWTAGIVAITSHFVIFNGLLVTLFHGWDHAWSENVAWLKMMNTASSHGRVDFNNVSPLSMLTKSGCANSVTHILSAGLDCVIVGAFWRLRRRPLGDLFALSWAVIPFMFSISWPYWVLLQFPLAVLVCSALLGYFNSGNRRERKHGFILLGVLVLYGAGVSTQNSEFINSGILTVASICLWWAFAWVSLRSNRCISDLSSPPSC